MTHTERVLHALRMAGPLGVTQADFHPPTIDNGVEIPRINACITSLREQGYSIRIDPGRGGDPLFVLYESEAP